MKRTFPFALALAIAAGLVGYGLGASAPSARAGEDVVARYEYKALSIIEFSQQGDKIAGEDWTKPSHVDLPFRKTGDALLQERVVVSRMMNAFAADGWEPIMIYQNAIIVRRPAPK